MGDNPTVISTDNGHVTLINIFTCAEDAQEALMKALDKATAELFAGLPGFISANIHAGLDRTRVVNYAQWESVEAFENMTQRPDVQEHMDEIMRVARTADPRLYKLRATYHP
ncbi:antibiotic biosynthesis monooxygenase family protein [Actinoplanes sp. NPDC051633]|uniref:antibiotic biosynthesis monooxygenase family protein n=1 Tax=Actinoplanes sp. NPDC051633 TaxID=3155670 RepID=UPI00344276C9